MKKPRPFEKGENVVAYASYLAHTLFEGVTRDTGLPYTTQHLGQTATMVEGVTCPSDYQKTAVAATWLHDSAEDIKGLDVFNPFKEPKRKRGTFYLNDLMAKAGEEGEAVCFIVDLMTNREFGRIYPIIGGYFGYVYNIFDIPNDSARPLHILGGCVKMSDRRMNINPDERMNVNNLVEEYQSLKGAGEKALIKFYKRTKTIDAFIKKGSMDFDVGLFVETINNNFMQKQRSAAVDNLSLYVPLAEQKLLIEIGENSGLFQFRRLRDVMKDISLESIKLYKGDIHEIRDLGLNKGIPPVPGYTRILKEIRTEIAQGKHALH